MFVVKDAYFNNQHMGIIILLLSEAHTSTTQSLTVFAFRTVSYSMSDA